MPNRAAVLKAKHNDKLADEPPPDIDALSWRVFTKYVRDGWSLRDITRETRLSASKVGLMVSLVDQTLDPTEADVSLPNLTTESPTAELMLSTRSRNALRELRCETIGSVLQKDFSKIGTRLRLGRVTRFEIATELARRGFDPPPSLLPSDPRAESLAAEMRKLRRRVDDDHRFWKEQLHRLEGRLRDLSKTDSQGLRASTDAT